jgi:hypothetical protein
MFLYNPVRVGTSFPSLNPDQVPDSVAFSHVDIEGSGRCSFLSC